MSKNDNELEETGMKYFNLINSILDVVVELSLDNTITYINHQVHGVFGYTPEELIGNKYLNLIHPDDVLKIAEAIKETLETGITITKEFRIRHKNGHYVPVLARGRKVEYNNQTKIVAVFREITREKEAQHRLKESDKRYREIIENIEDGYFEVDLQGNFTYVNDYICRYLGISREDLLKKNYSYILEKDTVSEVYETFTEVFSKNLPKGIFESEVIRNDGIKRIFEGSFYLKFGVNRKKVGFYGFTRDITENKASEKKIRESERKFRTIFNTIPDLFFLVGEDSTILDYSGKQGDLYVPPEQFLGKKMIDVLPSDVSELIKTAINNTLSSEKPQIVEYSLPIENDVRYYEARFLPFAKIKAALFVRNISEKQEAEQKLKESEERYRLISENANDLIIVFNEKFEYEYINENVHERVLGYRKEDLIGKNQLPFIHPDDRKQVIIATGKILRKGKGSHSMRFKHIDGRYKWLEITGRNFCDSKGNKKVLAIARDITERKEAEQKLKKSESKYREAYDRAELYKDLFYHDINNIISNIKFSIDLSEIYLAENRNEEIKDLYDVIRNQFVKGRFLISNVKKLSQLEDSETSLKSMDALKILNDSINDFLESMQSKSIDIKIEKEKENFLINANEFLIDIFDNLLVNAIKYNDKDIIEILIKISNESKEGVSYIKFEFIDNGIGVINEKKSLIFKERFSKEDGSKGLGFGLTLVKKIIESYSGRIWVEDKVNGDYTKGSNFVFIIPEVA